MGFSQKYPCDCHGCHMRMAHLYFPNDSISNCQSNVDEIGKLELTGKGRLLFAETNLFLMKMDYLETVSVWYFSNLKLNFLQCLDIVNWFFRDSIILYIALLIFT